MKEYLVTVSVLGHKFKCKIPTNSSKMAEEKAIDLMATKIRIEGVIEAPVIEPVFEPTKDEKVRSIFDEIFGGFRP